MAALFIGGNMFEKIINCEGCSRRREKMKECLRVSRDRVAKILGKATSSEPPPPPQGVEMTSINSGQQKGVAEFRKGDKNGKRS